MNFEKLYVTIGKKIRARRNKLHMTQDELANAEYVDLTRTSITNIEYGQQRIQIHTLYAIANALGLSIHDLLSDIEIDAEKSIAEILTDKAVVGAGGEEGLDAKEQQLILDLLKKE